jgi:hypothetical protein
MKWQTNDKLNKSHFLLRFWRVICFIMNAQQLRWRWTIPWRWLEEMKHWSLATCRALHLFQNLLTASKNPHNSLSSCCCSLLVPVNVRIYKVLQIWPGLIVCKLVTVCPGHIWTTLYLDATFRQSSPLSQHQNRHDPLLVFRFKFLSLLKDSLLQNFKTIVKPKFKNIQHRIYGFECLV